MFPYIEENREGYFDIAGNCELIQYLKEKGKAGRYDILFHGYSHEYRESDGAWKS